MAVDGYPGMWRYIMVAVSMIELLWFSGIMYGWGALVYVLKEEGFLRDLCPRENGTQGPNVSVGVKDCAMRDARFNLYFTLISSIGVLLILVVGHTFTRFGTRTTRLVFITTFCAGCLFIAFADIDYPWLVCLGGTLMIGSGYVFIITSTQFNMLFPGHSSTIVGIMNGMKVSSSFMQQLVKIAYDNGISRRTSYFGLFGLTLLTYISTIFLYPKDILKDKDKVKEINVNDISKNNGNVKILKANEMLKEKGNLKKNHNANQILKDKENEKILNANDMLKDNGNMKVLNVNDTLKNKANVKDLTSNGIIKGKGYEHKVNILQKGNSALEKLTGHNDKLTNHPTETQTAFDNKGFVNETTNGKSHNMNDDIKDRKAYNETLDVNSKQHGLEDSNGGFGEPIVCKQSTDNVYNNIVFVNRNTEHEESLEKPEEASDTLKTHMCGYLYLFNVLWFTVIRFRTNYFYGTINPFIEEVTTNNDDKVSYYTDVLSYSMASGILTCIVVGVLYDWQRRFFTGIENVKKRRVMSSVSPLITTCLVSVLLSSLVFVKDEMVLYPLTIIFTFFRSLLTTVGNTFLVDMFPASIYGTIYGTRFVIANVFSLIQYALYHWSIAYDGAGLHVNLFVLCLCLTTFIHPVSILLTNRREHRGKEVTHL